MISMPRVLFALCSTAVAAAAFNAWISNYQVTGSDVDHLVQRLQWWPVPLIIMLLALHLALAALRWTRIEAALGGAPPPFYRAFLAGAWAVGLSTFLPGPVATIACRGLSNRLHGANGLRGALGGGIDQLADLLVILLFCIPALLALATQTPALYPVAALALVVVGWGICYRIRGLSTLIIPKRLVDAHSSSFSFLTDRLIRDLYLLSLARIVSLTAINVMVQIAVGVSSPTVIAVSVPLVTLAMSAAMLPGSFGVAEWGYSWVLAGFTVPDDDAALYALANRLLLTLVGLGIGVTALLISIWASTQSQRCKTKATT